MKKIILLATLPILAITAACVPKVAVPDTSTTVVTPSTDRFEIASYTADVINTSVLEGTWVLVSKNTVTTDTEYSSVDGSGVATKTTVTTSSGKRAICQIDYISPTSYTVCLSSATRAGSTLTVSDLGATYTITDNTHMTGTLNGNTVTTGPSQSCAANSCRSVNTGTETLVKLSANQNIGTITVQGAAQPISLAGEQINSVVVNGAAAYASSTYYLVDGTLANAIIARTTENFLQAFESPTFIFFDVTTGSFSVTTTTKNALSGTCSGTGNVAMGSQAGAFTCAFTASF